MLDTRPLAIALAAVAAMACGPDEVVAYTAATPALSQDAGDQTGPPPSDDAGSPACDIGPFLQEAADNDCTLDLSDPCAPIVIRNGEEWASRLGFLPFPLPDAGSPVGESRQLERCDVVDFGYPEEDVFVLCPIACQAVTVFFKPSM